MRLGLHPHVQSLSHFRRLGPRLVAESTCPLREQREVSELDRDILSLRSGLVKARKERMEAANARWEYIGTGCSSTVMGCGSNPAPRVIEESPSRHILSPRLNENAGDS